MVSCTYRPKQKRMMETKDQGKEEWLLLWLTLTRDQKLSPATVKCSSRRKEDREGRLVLRSLACLPLLFISTELQEMTVHGLSPAPEQGRCPVVPTVILYLLTKLVVVASLVLSVSPSSWTSWSSGSWSRGIVLSGTGVPSGARRKCSDL